MKIETKRLMLRPVEERDADAIFRYLNDPDVTYNLLGHSLTREETLSMIAKWIDAFENRTAFTMGVTKKEDNVVMGICALLRVSWEHLHAELVYWLGKEYWGKGYMTEAVQAMLNFGFKHLGLERIEAGCFTRNTASRRVLEKVGFKYEGCARHKYFKDGEFLDEYRFAILRQEYSHD